MIWVGWIPQCHTLDMEGQLWSYIQIFDWRVRPLIPCCSRDDLGNIHLHHKRTPSFLLSTNHQQLVIFFLSSTQWLLSITKMFMDFFFFFFFFYFFLLLKWIYHMDFFFLHCFLPLTLFFWFSFLSCTSFRCVSRNEQEISFSFFVHLKLFFIDLHFWITILAEYKILGGSYFHYHIEDISPDFRYLLL